MPQLYQAVPLIMFGIVKFITASIDSSFATFICQFSIGKFLRKLEDRCIIKNLTFKFATFLKVIECHFQPTLITDRLLCGMKPINDRIIFKLKAHMPATNQGVFVFVIRVVYAHTAEANQTNLLHGCAV